MPGPWITEAALANAVANGIKKTAATLADYWYGTVDDPGILPRCRERGYVDIQSYLMGKGFTMAQLDAWDHRAVYNMDQSLFYCYVEGGGPEDQSERDIRRLDRITQWVKQEEPISLIINGVVVTPGAAAGEGALVASGQLTLDANGIDYGSIFGLRVRRYNGYNQYGDELPPGSAGFPYYGPPRG